MNLTFNAKNIKFDEEGNITFENITLVPEVNFKGIDYPNILESFVESEAIIENKDTPFIEKDSKKVLSGKVPLKDLYAGAALRIENREFLVLEQFENDTLILSSFPEYTECKFGDFLNWKDSSIRTRLHEEYAEWVRKNFGNSSLSLMERDLTTFYGLELINKPVFDYVSILSAQEYIKYYKIIGENKEYCNSWWTLTCCSSSRKNIMAVSKEGSLYMRNINELLDVYPIMKLNSSIEVEFLPPF